MISGIEPIIILVLIGALGGIVRGFLGFQMQADAGEKFSVMKMTASMIRAAVAGSLLVYSTADVSVDAGTKVYIGAFFTSIGAEVFLKELYGTVKPAAPEKK